MSTILIDDLSVPGLALILSEESYLNEINDDEFALTNGGAFSTPVCVATAVSGLIIVSYEFSKMAREIHDKNKGPIAWL